MSYSISGSVAGDIVVITLTGSAEEIARVVAEIERIIVLEQEGRLR